MAERKVRSRRLLGAGLALTGAALLSGAGPSAAGQSAAGGGVISSSQGGVPATGQAVPAPQAATSAGQPTSAVTSSGGTIRGTVKAGVVPLPGVAITATNTLTGKKYATTTDVNGAYEMTIPKTGRYVVRAELAAFAPVTSEVRITAEAAQQTAAFTLQLASRAAQAEAASQGASASGLAAALGRGTQALSMSGDAGGLTDASVGGGSAGAALPSLAGLGDSAASGSDSVTVSGQVGSTNALGGMSEDEIRQRVEDAMARARQQGGAAADQMNAVVGMLGNIMGGPGGFGGGRGGGGGGGGFGGGRGSFRNFNPTQPHGAIFYQGGFPELQAQASSAAALHALSLGTPYLTTEPSLGSQQNRFGVTYAGSPYVPGLTKPSTKNFVFFNVTGQRNITPEDLTGTVPSALERAGDFSQSVQTVNGTQTGVMLYDPRTGTPTQLSPGQTCAAPVAGSCVGLIVPASEMTSQARALLNYYPLPNVAGVTTNNYQTITTAGANSLIGSGRYVRNFGSAPMFGLGGGRRSQQNGPKTLRQNLNSNFSFSHSASDLRNIIPLLGGKTSTNGYNLGVGYMIGYGRVTNNASVTWNRSHATTTNYFTGGIDPTTAAGISVPSSASGLAQNGFYSGLPNVELTNFTSLTEEQPQDTINETISFSDFVSWSHKKHNMRFGTDIRRVHADQVGGNDVTGTFDFSGYVTENPLAQAATASNSSQSTKEPQSGSSLADLLIGQPQETKTQAALYKTYLRANVLDGYAQDDFRVLPGLTLNYGLRYEYFGPYFEKNNRLVNLDHNADFTVVDPVQPGGRGEFDGTYPRSLVNPDRDMFSPRFGLAWRPKWLEQTVVRGGYGINFNTGQFAKFAQSLSSQPPFAITQNNTLATSANATGCGLGNMTLANGFGCASKPITNNYAVDKNYRLGHVQVYNVDVQRTFPLGIVVNLGYDGSKGGDLDIVTAPNASVASVTTAGAQAFTYETSLAESRNNQLVLSARKRLQKGVAVQVLYQYGHSIDNASSIGGSSVSTVQNSQRLDLEEGNSSFDVRHKVTGNYVIELPFGPNRKFLASGGRWSKALDGFSVSGDFTFASGSYFTPVYENATAELAAGGTYTLRPDRVFTQPLSGPKNINEWFNAAAFAAPANGFGTASRNSIEGPGTVEADVSLSRTVQLGSTRSFEARLAATNAFNTVQYSSIDTTLNSATFGQVNATTAQRTVTLLARYRF